MQRATSVSESEGVELAFAPDLTVLACSKAYGRLLDVMDDALVGRPTARCSRPDRRLTD